MNHFPHSSIRVRRVLLAAAGLTLSASSVWADAEPLLLKGYYAVTNSVFVSPADPGALQVRIGGRGGSGQLGAFKVSSEDQRVDFQTGVQTGSVVLEDSQGQRLTGVFSGPSAQQPDGRVTFSGTLVFNGGTGRYAGAGGSASLDGWARVDPATGTGIGLVEFSGSLTGVVPVPSVPFALEEQIDGRVANPVFTATGTGQAGVIGRFTDVNQTVASPFSGFVGIVDGKFTAIYPFDSVWTTPSGDKVYATAVETVSFPTVFLPDGTPVPDITQASRAKVYQTIVGGTGRFAGAEGVVLATALFTPTGFDELGRLVIDGQLSGEGALTQRR